MMAKVYADLIRKGKKTIKDVPKELQKEVKAILAGDENDPASCLAFLILGKGGKNDMAIVYAVLIVKGKKTFADVPAKIQAQVREVLIENGGDIYAVLNQDMDIAVFAGNSPLSEKSRIAHRSTIHPPSASVLHPAR